MDLWQAIIAVVARADAVTLGLIVVLGAAAGFAMERVHSFTGVTLAALVGFGLGKVALALSFHRTHPFDQVIADLWAEFCSMTMLTFTAHALVVAAIVAAVAGLRTITKRAHP